MTINDILDNWDDVLPRKKVAKLFQILKFIEDEEDDENHNDLLLSLLSRARDYENDDYFGTEGLK